MSLLLAWVVFPAVLVALAIGCGLFLRATCGWRISASLLPAAGFALIVVITGFTTMSDATAELSTPLVLILALLGLVLAGRRADWPAVSGWELLAALGVFLVFAAPIVLSGKATFAGYIKLDDTATWMGFTDRVMTHGRSTSGLQPSTYEAMIAISLPKGYPVGAFLPLGVARGLVGQDVAWLVQPYMAAMAAMLALALAAITRSLLPSPRMRALVAFIAAQSALLFGYSLWGGIKEVAAALILALLAGAVPTSAGDWSLRSGLSWSRLVVTAISAAALLDVLGEGGAIWVVTILGLGILLMLLSDLGRADFQLGEALLGLVGAAFLIGVLAIPIVASGVFSATQGPLLNGAELGNLIRPLNDLQVIGIWPVGDFRLRPSDMGLTYLLLGVAVALGVGGLAAAVRAKAWTLLVYCIGTAVGCLAIVLVASPWVDAKALASASPAVLLAACAGAGFLTRTDARPVGWVVLLAIGGGVVWSNILAYHDVNLAPRDQLAELQSIGNQIAGQGPTLTTDSKVYGGRHFLRDAAPENSTDLRRRQIPLVNGDPPDQFPEIDPDRLALPGLLTYRTLVLRRSPTNSRPPSPYRLLRSGRFYDVWQRQPGSEHTVIRHLGLGHGNDPTGVPDCGAVLDLAQAARQAGPNARLAAAAGSPSVLIEGDQTVHPRSWQMPGNPNSLFLTDSGKLSARFSVVHGGDYRIWLGGTVRGGARALVHRQPVGSIDGQLAGAGEYTEFGLIHLSPGRHQLMIDYDSKPLSPGTRTPTQLPYPSGPIAISSGPEDPKVRNFEPAAAGQLCGRRWDWIEVVIR